MLRQLTPDNCHARRPLPSQIEASRRNGARSRGPVTPEGKARSSRNALTHGLTAMQHLVLEDEAPDDLDELIETITEETGAVGEIEARLARRLAIAFWKGERAEKMEVALLDAAPRTRMNGYRQEEADPLTTFDVRRFNAIRGHQAAQGREISRCLKELRMLRKEAMESDAREPEAVLENEPKGAARAAWPVERAASAEPDAPPDEPGHEPPTAPLVRPPAPVEDRIAELRAAVQAEAAALESVGRPEEVDLNRLHALTRELCLARLGPR